MIEIKSDWRSAFDDDGNPFEMLILFMSIDKKTPVNCALNVSGLDPEGLLGMLTLAIEQLTHACYPQLTDTLYLMKKELKELEGRVEFVKKNVRDMERARSKHEPEPDFEEVK